MMLSAFVSTKERISRKSGFSAHREASHPLFCVSLPHASTVVDAQVEKGNQEPLLTSELMTVTPQLVLLWMSALEGVFHNRKDPAFQYLSV